MELDRKTMRLMKPNPLFEKLLIQMIREADSVDRLNYEKALESLRKYPLVLSSGKECLILEHFDAALCIKIDQKLTEHKSIGQDTCTQNLVDSKKLSTNSNLRQPETEELLCGSSTSTSTSSQPMRSSSPSPSSRGSKEPETITLVKKKPYLPKNRSGAFALLVTLLKNCQDNPCKIWMSKSELQKAAQPLCDSSFTKPQHGSFYTAWSCMSQLITKSLVNKQGHPSRFSLSKEGLEIGMKLMAMYPDELEGFIVQNTDPSSLLTVSTATELLAPGKKQKNLHSNSRGSGCKQTHMKQKKIKSDDLVKPAVSGPEFLLPNSFDVILLVDVAETIGAHRKIEDGTLRELNKLLVKHEVRKLNVGDFLWVARHRESGLELVLPYIIERKRMDDLSKSIKDGRFQEQKFRLKNCGLQFLIYLVENMGKQERFGLPLTTLNFSITRTQVFDGFSVQIKRNHKESVLFLAQCTSILYQMFKDKTLFRCKKEDIEENIDPQDDVISLCTFQDFSHNIGKCRNFSVKEMLQKQLQQLHGVSSDMAWSIVQLYPTPACLRNSFLASGAGLLEDLQYRPLQRRIGPIVSSVLHAFYTSSHFNV